MLARHLFFTWAPPESVWSPWAKPVLFAELPEVPAALAGGDRPLTAQEVSWLSVFGRRTAVILDLPGAASIIRGLQLATHGYRPVPLFNTSHGFREVVPTRDIIAGLRTGGAVLGQLSLPADAPPAFLLDANRLPYQFSALPGSYDNRWVVLPQDFPSGSKLREQGIDTVLLWQDEGGQPREDLAHVLLRWQEAGLTLFLKHGEPDLPPELLVVRRPSRYRSLLYRFFVLLGLRRNSAGGFGGMVPEPSQTSGFG